MARKSTFPFNWISGTSDFNDFLTNNKPVIPDGEGKIKNYIIQNNEENISIKTEIKENVLKIKISKDLDSITIRIPKGIIEITEIQLNEISLELKKEKKIV